MSPVSLLLAAALAQETPVFRADVEAVYVDVYVTRRGAAVAGLSDRDFVVKDNGVPQAARVVEREEAPLTAVLVLDCSESVAGAKLEFLKAAAGSFVRGLHPRDEAALVAFQSRVELLHLATTDREALLHAIARMTASGSTSLIDALFLGLKRHWGNGRPVLVLFSDGRDTASWLENEDLLRAARESSTTVYVVRTRAAEVPEITSTPFTFGAHPAPPTEGRGPGESGEDFLLRRVVETTGGSSWSLGSGPEIEAAFRQVLETVNARYVLAYEPTGTVRAGRHRIEVKVRQSGVEVRARREYFVPGGTSPRSRAPAR